MIFSHSSWLHSYILTIREEEFAVYMVFAIVGRLEREGQSGKIVLREKVNMTNNNVQVDTFLLIHKENCHTSI